jgi:hypothetical protein
MQSFGTLLPSGRHKNDKTIGFYAHKWKREFRIVEPTLESIVE